ncbi:MAG: zinc ribbon domain-containing protein [Phycisphaeraceae bacterium]|nr:zinc ribbon domain-containing protein [Phycisphaeraceae bacterium]
MDELLLSRRAAELRKIIIRILLTSLAIGAVGGAAAILLGRGDFIWRVVGTAVLTTGAMLLMWPLSVLLGKELWRDSAMLGLVVIVLEYLVILSMIWEWVRHLTGWGWRAEEVVGMTGAGLILPSLAAMGFLVARQKPLSRWAGRFGLTLSGIVLAIFLTAAWGAYPWDNKLWETGFTLGGYGLLIAALLVGVGVERGRHWRWLGILGAAAGCAMWIGHVWTRTGDAAELFTGVTCMAIVLAHANLVIRAPLPVGGKWLIPATILAMLAAALAVEAATFTRATYQMAETFGRCAGAAGIIAACGTLAIGVLIRFAPKIIVADDHVVLREARLLCPVCGKRNRLLVGQMTPCSGCGAKLTVQVQEPRCPQCGYLMVGLAGRACPECGHAGQIASA